MPVPSPSTFARLGKLVAIDEPAERSSRAITEAFTGKELAQMPIGNETDVERAFARARAAQKEWAKTSLRSRAAILRRFQTLVFQKLDELADIVQAETGKARASAVEEVLFVATAAGWYAANGPKILKEKRVKPAVPILMDARVRHLPKGVVGVISPWNYPMALSVQDANPAWLAGNAVIMKPDSQTPFSTLALSELLYEAGLPRDVLQTLPGPGQVVGNALAEQADYLMFTGSTATGKSLAEQCGRRLIGFSGELGGKNPMIVTATANIRRAALGATRACFSNSGQLCISIERIYVQEQVYEQFINEFVAQTKAMRLGAGYSSDIDMGSLISEAQLKTVDDHVNDAVSKGAKVLIGGKARPDLGPYFYEPTVLGGVREGMTLYKEETFGPVVSVYPVKTVAEAIAAANDTRYGLNCSVWAGTWREGQEIAGQIYSGSANVNEGFAAWASHEAPCGGTRESGAGRRNGAEGLLKYTETQGLVTQRFLSLSGERWFPGWLLQRILPTVMRLVRLLPGR
ncbi:Aldehyde Dehydrogenase [Segniliparus rotundus DSM 44985]|uniref:succinate-semialdehyde dehydrogenase (NADP(+)) n=1 Tax=Segniliparus rotundus (strain ATCC BAA-972 / CDC 1076 / CIP 108378 / DSM 44985 / JCM 13578) TaxID=640132 RepID=D6ZB48_SEGRD|nr:succinic semialdehyde dehydrogenase [Segniliparus rotundus]ADG96807.1 Aldehyde Dehydrogenase [Segniliparus rotundus DSM 44985]